MKPAGLYLRIDPRAVLADPAGFLDALGVVDLDAVDLCRDLILDAQYLARRIVADDHIRYVDHRPGRQQSGMVRGIRAELHSVWDRLDAAASAAARKQRRWGNP